MRSDDLVTLLFNVAEKLGEGLIETLIGAMMSHTDGRGDLFEPLELDDGTILPHLLHLLAVFDVDIGGRILLIVLYSEAIARHGATTT